MSVNVVQWQKLVSMLDYLDSQVRTRTDVKRSAGDSVKDQATFLEFIQRIGATPTADKFKEDLEKFWKLHTFVVGNGSYSDSSELVQKFAQAYRLNLAVADWMTVSMKYAERTASLFPLVTPIRLDVYRLFKSLVFDPVMERLVNAVCAEIKKERQNEVVVPDDIQCCIDAFKFLGEKSRNHVLGGSTYERAKFSDDKDSLELYENSLEIPYLSDTREFYATTAANLLLNPSTFVDLGEALVGHEQKISSRYLHHTTVPKVMKIIIEELLLKSQERIIGDEQCGLRRLLEGQQRDSIRKMFDLYERIDNQVHTIVVSPFALMGKILHDYLVAEGTELNKQYESGTITENKDFIEKLIAMYNSYDPSALGITGVKGRNQVNFERDSSFKNFFNKDLKTAKQAAGAKADIDSVTAAADRLAAYFDRNLQAKDGNELAGPALETPIHFIELLENKDHFTEAYRKFLSRRLINPNANCESERQILEAMKTIQAGTAITHKLIGMLQEKQAQPDIQANFAKFLQNMQATEPSVSKLDLTAQVFATGQWPEFSEIDLVLPPSIAAAHQLFETFYNAQNSSRKIRWVHAVATVEVHRAWGPMKKIMSMNAVQALVLLAFNDRDNASPKEMQEMYRLSIDIARHIGPFMKMKILKFATAKQDENKLNENDRLTVNEAFKIPNMKFKIPSPQESSRRKTHEAVDESRKHAADACIVRIMKARKIMQHADLVAEGIRQLSALFKPDPKVIKQRVEDLISREFLRRDDEDRNKYHYLA